MSRFTYLKIFLLIAGTVSLLGIAFYFFSKNNELLLKKVDEISRPDYLLHELKQLNHQLNIAENHVRAFTLSQTEDYINQYSKIKESIRQQIESLSKAADATGKWQTDSLSGIINQQLNIYDELLSISYSRVLDSALADIREISITDSSEFEDSASAANLALMLKNSEKKKNFFSDLFSNKKKQRELQTLIKKAQEDMDKKQQAIQRAAETKKQMAEAAEKQRQQIKELNEREFRLLEQEKKLNAQYEKLLADIEQNRNAQNEKNVFEARQSVARSSMMLKWLMMGGSVLIMLLTLLLVFDIINADKRRKELYIAQKKAEKLAASRQQFLNMMSHEIRTPLSGIDGYTTLLLRTNISPQQQGYLNNIKSSTGQLLTLVDDILKLSQLDAGRLPLNISTFSPAQVTENVCDLLRVKANMKNIVLSCNIKDIEHLFVSGDPDKLSQILYNLIGNAVKFTDKGSVSVECKHELSGENRVILKFIIRDTGIGIPEDKIPLLFQDYAQADITIPKRFGGTGLGLSITRKLVELHQGNIKLKSIEGMGTEFTVSIPYTLTKPAAEPPREETVLKENTISLHGIKVLIADDTKINLMLQEEILHSLGAETCTAGSGREAVELIRQHPSEFDIALIDLRMSDLNGDEAVRIIRQDIKSSIPVIATTANPVSADREKLLQLGFNDVLIKPFEQLTLAKTIHGLIPEKIKEAKRDNPMYNLRELELTSRGNSDFVHRMMKVFLFSAESMIKKLQTASTEKNFELMAATAHRLIPSCRQLSINYMTERLKWIENNSRPGLEKELEEKIYELKQHFEAVKFSMEEEFAKNP